jgi:DNA repair exonuclease SbcCD ATPase subunit
MKQVNFKKISITNFLSIGKEPVSIEFETGTNIITGVNKDMMDRRNGVGKSTIADALYFAIFGTTMRELKKDLIINNYTNATCSVTLVFDVIDINNINEYKVVRTLNPSKCFLFKNNEDVTRDSIINTTQSICDLIDASPSIFKNCVIMTLSETVPFMAQSKIDKRKFIENIFNLQVFSKMLAHVREEHNEYKKKYEMELFKYNEISASIKKLQEQRNAIIRERLSKVAQLAERKLKSNDELASLQQQLDVLPATNYDQINETIQELEKCKNKCQEKIDALLQKIAVEEIQLKNLKEQHSNAGTNNDVCPTCLRVVDATDVNHIEAEKQKLTGVINELKQLLEVDKKDLTQQKTNKDSVKNFISKYNAKINQGKVDEARRNSINKEINLLQEWIKDVDADINQLNTTSTEVDANIDDQANKSNAIADVVKEKLEQVNLLDTMKVIVSEEGVKAYITKKILQILNSKIQIYLKKIGFNCSCKFNEYFEEEIHNDRGKLCSYFNFSGAERKSIDLACLFAFIDVRRMQGNVSYNIMFYDELFDSSLDEKGVELAYQIIADRAKLNSECAYIITHRKSSNFFATSNVIQLVKENGITKRVE